MSVETQVRTLGRYRLYDQIAAGGMATVHFGRQLGAGSFSRVVAIKRLSPNYAQDPDFVQMFLDEARLAARVRHPNVVTTIDVVAQPQEDGEEVFLVMEYVLGEPLSRLVRNNEHVCPLPVASAIMCGVLEGLHAAHEARGDQGELLQLVHRDVSPQNVLVGVDGVARVFDFGIAKAIDNAQQTREGMIKGKVSYMAPEQVHVGDLDRRADLYAAGVVFWELLAGRRLRAGEKNDRLFLDLARGTLEPPPPPSSVRAEVPPACDAIIAKATRIAREERYDTAREMALAIEEAIPPASPRVVAAWLEEVSKEHLARAREFVMRIENDHQEGSEPRLPLRGSSTRIPVAGSTSSSASAVTKPSDPSVSVVESAPQRKPKALWLAIAALVVVVAILLRNRSTEGPTTTASQPPQAQSAPAPAASTASAMASAIPSAQASASADPSVEVKAAAKAPRFKPVAVQAKKEKEPPPAPSPAPAAAKTGCENPFSIGPDGIRQVKPECL